MSATAKSMSSVKEARELYELKERAAKYYAENGVPEKMEEILNTMFYDSPNDVYGHLVNYFQTFADPPVISKIQARTAIDGKGQATLQTDVYCTINNREKLVSTCVNSTVMPTLSEMAKPEDVEEEIKERDANVNAAICVINSDVCTKLEHTEPTKQQDIDAIVKEVLSEFEMEEEARLAQETAEQGSSEGTPPPDKKPMSGASKTDKPKSATKKGGKGGAPVVIVPDEPLEKIFPGSVSISAVSQAVCSAAASSSGIELYDYIGALRFGQTPKELRLPLPMVTILQGGRAAPGKSNCVKEYMLIPSPHKPLKESIPQILAVYNDVIKATMVKGGIISKNVTDLGAYMITLDRPEQGLDLLQDSMNRLGFTPGEDMYIALNLCGQEVFDYEKGKYEVITGQQKTADDLVEFYSDIVTRYPAIIALIDPMRKQEQSQWMLLTERLSEKCYVLGDTVWHRPGLLKDEEITENFKSSGNIYRLEQMNSISDIVTCAQKMEGEGFETVFATTTGETTDTFLSDMAVGLRARFLKMGAPCRGERVSKLNRLISIEAALEDQDRLVAHGDFTFPIITHPPTPEPEEGAEIPIVPEPKASPKKK